MSEDLEAARASASDAIVQSRAGKRLIVAGPGTGKTFTFQQALRAAGSSGLALTFIRNLVADLTTSLDGLADVYTFHGFCKHLMHKHNVAGLTDGDYYPPLFQILTDDVRILTQRNIAPRVVEHHFHDLDESDGLIRTMLERADYYDAVSHTDLVYRVLRHFQDSADAIPQFPLIVVDEVQDFSLLETEFIELLSTRSPILAAGDDDQALYVTLKHASPQFIRRIARSDDYACFELPYCSRCTSAVVGAVNSLVQAATEIGCLKGRLPKSFSCYLPSKAGDSAAYPQVVHAHCSTANQPYVGNYIAQQIAHIPAEDIKESHETGYPTALIVGPNPFLKQAFEAVRKQFPYARMKTSGKVEIELLDGYRRIAFNEDSRLGWRIIMSASPFPAVYETLRQALEADTGLHEALPETYRTEHLRLARLIRALFDGAELAGSDEADLVTVLEQPLDVIRTLLAIESSHEEEDPSVPDDSMLRADEPDILFTSIVGSKGLSAGHVFVVGLMNGHLPRKKTAITDEEVCGLLVALSRTRKQCHLVSAGFFGSGPLQESVFLDWLRPHMRRVNITKEYDFAA